MPRDAHRVWRLPSLFLVAGLLCAACDHDQDVAGSFPPPPPPPPPFTAPPLEPLPSAVADASTCPTTHPLVLQWVPESDEEAAALEGLVGCADTRLTNIWLDNASDSVWVVAEPAGLQWPEKAQPPLDVALFRRTLTPDGTLPVEPGITATIASAPEGLRLVLSENATTSWATVQWLEETANATMFDGFERALEEDAPSRKSFFACARAGWEAGDVIASAPLAEGSDKVEVLVDAMGLTAQGSACGVALAEASEEARAKPAGAAVIVTEADLLRAARSPLSTQLDDASKSLGLASKVASGLRILLRR